MAEQDIFQKEIGEHDFIVKLIKHDTGNMVNFFAESGKNCSLTLWTTFVETSAKYNDHILRALLRKADYIPDQILEKLLQNDDKFIVASLLSNSALIKHGFEKYLCDKESDLYLPYLVANKNLPADLAMSVFYRLVEKLEKFHNIPFDTESFQELIANNKNLSLNNFKEISKVILNILSKNIGIGIHIYDFEIALGKNQPLDLSLINQIIDYNKTNGLNNTHYYSGILQNQTADDKIIKMILHRIKDESPSLTQGLIEAITTRDFSDNIIADVVSNDFTNATKRLFVNKLNRNTSPKLLAKLYSLNNAVSIKTELMLKIFESDDFKEFSTNIQFVKLVRTEDTDKLNIKILKRYVDHVLHIDDINIK